MQVMSSMILFVVLVGCVFWLVYARREKTLSVGQFDALCEVTGSYILSPIVEPCVVALFHAKSFRVRLPLFFDEIGEYCSDDSENLILDEPQLVLVTRGQCPFDTKVRHVENIGSAKGVLITDLSAVHATETPLSAPGSADPTYQSEIPCVLVGRRLFDVAAALQEYNRHFDRQTLGLANISLRQDVPLQQRINLTVSIEFESEGGSKPPAPVTDRSGGGSGARVSITTAGWVDAATVGRTSVVWVATGMTVILASSIGSASLIACSCRRRWLYPVSVTAVILAVALLLRCGTFRTSSPERLKDLEFMVKMRPGQVVPGALLAPYAHTETDELVYEVLVQSVARSLTDYSLYDKVDVLQQLGLSFSHYHMKIFIHPPNFVYFCAFCSELVRLPLVAVPLLCQCVTLLCVGWIGLRAGLAVVEAPLSPSLLLSARVAWNCALWSMLLYAFCPISVFISQKLWIDNMLCMAISAAAGLHLHWTLRHIPAPGGRTAVENDPCLLKMCEELRIDAAPSTCAVVSYVLRCIFLLNQSAGVLWTAFGSSLCFTLLACNTKITALSVLPCLGIYSSLLLTRCVLEVLFRQLKRPLPEVVAVKAAPDGRKRAVGENGRGGDVSVTGVVVLSLLLCTSVLALVFVLGLMVGHGPWILLYKVRTDRWMPNAWPSGEMLRNSPYMQKVVGRPWYFYLKLLAEAAPVHLFGMCYGLWRVAGWAKSLLLLHRRSWSLGAAAPAGAFESVLALFDSDKCVVMLLTLWALSVLAGHNVLGILGAGYQTRFIAPLTTPCCVLAAMALTTHGTTTTAVLAPGASALTKDSSLEESGVCASPVTVVIVQQSELTVPVVLLLLYSAMMTLFYGVLHAPLFADFDYSIWDIIFSVILTHPSHNFASGDKLNDVISFMKHFGLKMD